MPDSPTPSRQPASVAGGTGVTPTPANNVGGRGGWGDRSFRKGGTGDVLNQKSEHVDPKGSHDTMSDLLRDQSSRAEAKYLQRSDPAGDIKPTTESGEPTCTSEDHSFMNTKPGGADTWPGWGTVKYLFRR